MSAKTKFILLTTQRTGSSMFIDLLNSHPDIRTYNEVFIGRPRTENPWDDGLLPEWRFYEYKRAKSLPRPFVTFSYLNNIAREGLQESQATGFKLMYGQLKAHREILLYAAWKNYKVIHHIRSNYFDNHLSQQFNKKYQVRHVVNGFEKEVKETIFLDTDTLLTQLNNLKKRTAKHQKMLKFYRCNYIETTYENLTTNKPEVLRQVEQFLSIPSMAAEYSTKFQKVDQRNYQEKIENYEEVAKALKGTPFQID